MSNIYNIYISAEFLIIDTILLQITGLKYILYTTVSNVLAHAN